MDIQLSKDESGVYTQRIRIGKHTLISDEPVELGGDDAGPNPHDLFDASLAACKAITLLMYAQRREMPLEGVDIEVKRDESREREGHYTLNVSLDLKGNLDEDQRKRLAEIADRCPIHKLMTKATIDVQTSLLPPPNG